MRCPAANGNVLATKKDSGATGERRVKVGIRVGPRSLLSCGNSLDECGKLIPPGEHPRIVEQLHQLGIEVAKSTVEKYKPRGERLPSETWRTFLDQHLKELVAIGFSIVPTATFKVLFVFLMLAHDRRRIVQFNVPEHPTAQWTAQAAR